MAKSGIDNQIERAFIEVEDKLMIDLLDAECKEDVYDLLYAELEKVIRQYGLDFITPDKVLPEFWKVYNLKDSSCMR